MILKNVVGIRRGTVVAATALTLALAACSGGTAESPDTAAPGSQSAAGKTLVIGFAQQSLTAPYFVAMQKEAERMAKQEGFKLVFQAANMDPVTQINQAETMVAQGIDALLVNTVNVETEEPKMREMAKKLPLVFIDTAVPDVGVSAVQSDNVAIGHGAGLIMAKRFKQGETIKVGILNGGARDVFTGPNRRKGFLSGLEDGGIKYEIVIEADANYAQEAAVTAAESMLAAHPDLDVIYGYNDSMALGALQTLRTLGNTTTLVAGIDGQKEALKEILDGGCKGQYVSTGLNSPTLATRKGLEIVLSILRGKSTAADFPKLITTKAAGIGCENIKDYYDPNSVF